MDYSYNYGFLRQFREEHKLSKKDLLEAFGSSDYTGINRWLDGKTPVHLTAMLRFCNYYQISPEDFFFDADGGSTLHIKEPTEFSQTMPTDGYGMGRGAGKSIIGTHVSTRSISSPAQARTVSEGLQRAEKPAEEVPAVCKAVSPTPPATSDNETLLRLQLAHANELRQLEQEHHAKEEQIRRDCQAHFDAERNRLMDIIERQSAELAKVRERSGYRVGMAAEEDPSSVKGDE